jgi:N-acetylmuramoyl-L-alanine amidase
MSNPNLFKRRLLRAAVQDNVNVMQENWPRLTSQARSRRPTWFGYGIVSLVAFALFSLVYSIAIDAENRRVEARIASPLLGAVEGRSSVEGGIGLVAGTLKEAVSVAEEAEARHVGLNRTESASPAMPTIMVDPETLVSVLPKVNLYALALPVKRIVIDPGHGGDDPGATTPRGLTEKELALDIGLRLRDLLLDASFDVRMTRETDKTVPLVQRFVFANREEGDLFISIHVNWVESRRIRVVETYYLGPTDDSATLQLTGVENQHSGYALSDFRKLLEKMYTDVKRGESRKLAEAVQDRLVQTLQKTNPTLTPRAVKTAPFVVLIGTAMPAILTEVACLSNEDDEHLLASAEYRGQIARALFTGIREYTTTLQHASTKRKDAPS